MAETIKRISRAMAYYRLSKEDGEKEISESIANQRKLIQEYVANAPDIQIVSEEYDDGYTGTNFDRPGFQRVLAAIEKGRVDCVIVKDLSRLGREYIETGKYIEMVFPSLEVRFIAVNDDFDSNNRSQADDILVPIKNIINESYCRDLSKKLRRQFRIQRQNGEFLCAFASYGYQKSPENNHVIIIDEPAAEVVRRIFGMRLQGMSPADIAKHLNTIGVLSPAAYKREHFETYKSGFCSGGEDQWTTTTIFRILRNRIYVGDLEQGKRGTPNYKIKKMHERKREDWCVVKSNHTPIIDEKLFLIVQKQFDRCMRKSTDTGTTYPLSGLLFCADCGSSMVLRTVVRSEKKFRYYVCSANKQGKACTSHSFSQVLLEDKVLMAIQSQISLVIEYEKLEKEMHLDDFLAAKLRQIDASIALKQSEIDADCEYRMKLYEAFTDSLIGLDEYNRMRERYTCQIDEASCILADLMDKREKICENPHGQQLDWIGEFLKYRNIRTLTYEAAASLIERILIHEDKRIEIHFNYHNELMEIISLIGGQEGGEEHVS